MGKKCYLCGSKNNLTRDHVPPKGFFPPPLPSNLITVPCCKNCNESWQKEDEAVRSFFSLAEGRSAAGEQIWEQKVINGTIVHSAKFHEYLLTRIKDFAIPTSQGTITLPTFELPKDRVERFMIRITKGLLCHHYPEYDYSNSTFSVRFIPPTEDSLQWLEAGLVGTKYDERGAGVVRYRYGLTDTQLSGVWFYMFYDAVWYLVHHIKTA